VNGRLVVSPVLAALLLPLMMAACGGGAAGSSQPPAVGTAFASKADAVCQEALAEKKALGPFPYPDFNPTQPDLSLLPSIAQSEAKTVKIFETWLPDMVALGQPPIGEAAWADVLAALRSHVRIIVEQEAAGLSSDGPTFTKDYYEGNRAQDEMVRAADAAGVPICATAAGA
jgi:hypothetical protein